MKLTLENFIYRSNIIHKFKYDYSKVIYKNSISKVIIVCKEHGEFEQTVGSHLSGHGCPDCSGKKIIGKDNFIKKSNEVHKFKYDYSKVKYINNKIKVIVICSKHGEFSQTPKDHLKGSGCPKCLGKGFSLEEFIDKFNKIHNFKYDYSKVKYVSSKEKIIIICKKHGEFKQKCSKHLNGQGCPECSGKKKLNTEDFIKRSNTVHNFKYDYSKVKYKGPKNKISIICPIHGEFKQIPNSHLIGIGCSKCSSGGCVSKVSQEWLDSLKDNDIIREYILKINGKIFRVDGCNIKLKIVYEFNGDFWHGNPKIFNRCDVNYRNNKTFGYLYDETIKRKKYLEENGFKVISIWENEWKILKKEKIKNGWKNN